LQGLTMPLSRGQGNANVGTGAGFPDAPPLQGSVANSGVAVQKKKPKRLFVVLAVVGVLLVAGIIARIVSADVPNEGVAVRPPAVQEDGDVTTGSTPSEEPGGLPASEPERETGSASLNDVQFAIRTLAFDYDPGVISVGMDKRGYVVSLQADIIFEPGSAELNSTGMEIVELIANEIKHVDSHILVMGHTDNVPINTIRFPSNYSLSLERALGVYSQLRQNTVIQSMSLAAMGEYSPIADNSNVEGRQQNRRVEIVFLYGFEDKLLDSLNHAAVTAVNDLSFILASEYHDREALINAVNALTDYPEQFGIHGAAFNITVVDHKAIVLYRSSAPGFYGDMYDYIKSINIALGGGVFADKEPDLLTGTTSSVAIPVIIGGRIIGAVLVRG